MNCAKDIGGTQVCGEIAENRVYLKGVRQILIIAPPLLDITPEPPGTNISYRDQENLNYKNHKIQKFNVLVVGENERQYFRSGF